MVGGEREQKREMLENTRRELADYMEELMRRNERRLVTMRQAIREWDGTTAHLQKIDIEQMAFTRMLQRVEVAQVNTSDLLREWRDWMRALRQGTSEPSERVEMVCSELRLRGVLDQNEERITIPSAEIPRPCLEEAFAEWDQYLGHRLPATVLFWRQRMAGIDSVEDTEAIRSFVTRARLVEGHGKIWKKLTRNVQSY